MGRSSDEPPVRQQGNLRFPYLRYGIWASNCLRGYGIGAFNQAPQKPPGCHKPPGRGLQIELSKRGDFRRDCPRRFGWQSERELSTSAALDGKNTNKLSASEHVAMCVCSFSWFLCMELASVKSWNVSIPVNANKTMVSTTWFHFVVRMDFATSIASAP